MKHNLNLHKALPTDNRLINLIWIGPKPLPSDGIRTILAYASLGQFPVVLWVDRYQAIQEQFEQAEVAKSGMLHIHPVTELFESTADTTEILLSAMHQREKYGAGSLGARLDLIKVQIAHKFGGIIADFDALAKIANKKEKPEMQEIFTIFDKLIDKKSLLYKLRGNPDFFVACHHTQDTQWLREIQIDVARIHAATIYGSGKMTRSCPRELKATTGIKNKIYSEDPLFHLPEGSFFSNRDVRRSAKGWRDSISADLTMDETGSFLTTFAGYKARQMTGLMAGNVPSREQFQASMNDIKRTHSINNALENNEILTLGRLTTTNGESWFRRDLIENPTSYTF